MDKVPELITMLAEMPIEHLLGLIALAVVGLAVFAIHAVSSLAKDRNQK